jgi:hypothetical protein
MGLKIRIEWYDKESEIGIGEEFSKDMGDDESILNTLGIPVENNINNGGFDVGSHWIDMIQPHFSHCIDLTTHDYQLSFDYRESW